MANNAKQVDEKEIDYRIIFRQLRQMLLQSTASPPVRNLVFKLATECDKQVCQLYLGVEYERRRLC